MTDLYSGQLTDLLQNDLKDNPDVRAISFAIQKEKQRILDLERKTRTLSRIDELDEDILDVLGVELRIPYYSQSFTLENKRAIVKTAMMWFYKAGTASGMTVALNALNGDSSVEEWFQYGDLPGFFRVNIPIDITQPTTQTDLKQIVDVVNAYKPVRSRLEEITYRGNCAPTEIYAGGCAVISNRVEIWPEVTVSLEAEGTVHDGGPGPQSQSRVEIWPEGYPIMM